MSWYPRIFGDRRKRANTQALPGQVGVAAVGHYSGEASALDTDGYVAVTDMQVGEYTLLRTTPTGDFPRNVTLTHADTDATDTLGTVQVLGRDAEGFLHLETLTPVANDTVQGTYCFVEIISITGVDWVISSPTNEDQIQFGWGDLIGLPYRQDAKERVFMATLDGVVDTIAAQRAHPTFIDWNNVQLTTPLTAVDVDIYFII